jgi:putative selenate reductase
MNDRFHKIGIEKLLKWILEEEKQGRIFGIYKELFFNPKSDDPYKMLRYGKLLETPIGVAAGPHSQLAHNIIASWLCGARYIELKTVQTLDEIEVTKPCIDMEDEGYNCEWSQELKVQESFDEYLNAWIIIHLLKKKFNWESKEAGFIFNLSVGYDYKGILKPNVQWFFDKIENCQHELEDKLERISRYYPDVKNLEIPHRISDNITLSTMHGCPPDEIERICSYLIKERKLHTSVKLNPTLLGHEKLRWILNYRLGYKITIPDEAFDHDLKYDDALRIIKSLSIKAEESGVQFGLKLTNTLESLNSAKWLPSKEIMVYTSGRALHPITINLAEKLQNDFDGNLDISFSGGVDAFNITDTLSCNLRPVTVCSDLLKPGGYLRLTQYIEKIQKEFSALDSHGIEEFITKKAGGIEKLNKAALKNLKAYAVSVLENKAYHKTNFPYENIKTQRTLTEYDCVHAPCIESCAVEQNVPEYMYHTAKGEFEEAYKAILADNPLPNMTGNVCDHLCQTKCTRINYDNPLLIREIKRFISEKFESGIPISRNKNNKNKVAVIGAGPSGLSCAYFLATNGFEVEIFESKSFAGGMVSGLIPYFRLSDKSVANDLSIFQNLGIKFHFNIKVDSNMFNQIRKEFNFIYIGVGAQKSKKLGVPGENLEGIFDQLSFLSRTRQGEKINLGKRTAIIGGGLSAIDAARTAKRIIGKNGKVTMIYRRTKNEMPADTEEIQDLFEEDIKLIELCTPIGFKKNGLGIHVQLVKMELKEPDQSGRPRPVIIKNSEFSLEFDNIITAIGQDLELEFIPGNKLILNNDTNEIQFENVFAGGDAVRGADSLINGMGDGKKIAETILLKSGIIKNMDLKLAEGKLSPAEFQRKQAYREFGVEYPTIGQENRLSFELVHPTLDDYSAMKEAERCLYCNDICNTCVGVCPNFANLSFQSEVFEMPIYQAVRSNDTIKIDVVDNFSIKQKNQILNIGDFCNECGNCTTFCPTSGDPYKIKPRFHLTKESFDIDESGYLLDNKTITYKDKNEISSLSETEDNLVFENNVLVAKFDIINLSIIEINFKDDSVKNADLRKAAEMIYLLRSLKKFTIFA